MYFTNHNTLNEKTGHDICMCQKSSAATLMQSDVSLQLIRQYQMKHFSNWAPRQALMADTWK